jgi:cell division transport system ATP-binding protein
MIRFEHVAKRYPNGRDALSGVSFDVAAGEMVYLTGRSGAGKSTLLKLIALLERPTRGKVTVNDVSTATLPNRQIPAFRRKVGVVFQDHKLLADRTVFDNVALPLIVAGMMPGEADRRVRAALDQVALLGKESMLPQELSVGEQQRVGIARAIVGRPPVLIADEPTGNLDPQLAGEVMALFRRLNELGTTVVVATHDIATVQRSGLRELVLQDGRLQGGDNGEFIATAHLTAADLPTIQASR